MKPQIISKEGQSNMADHFTWIPFYHELAQELAKWQDRQLELIALLEDLRKQGCVITPLMDRNADGERFLLQEIDPFTFFGVFNRQLQDEKRLGILSKMKQHFQLRSALPADFQGIPVLNNMSSWFIAYQDLRADGDVKRLWRVFQLALQAAPLQNPEFLQAFDNALTVRQTNVNLTMGLFWIRADTFLNLDQTNRAYLGIKLPPGGLTAKFYTDTLRSVLSKGKSLSELSHEAWLATHAQAPIVIDRKTVVPKTEDVGYWLVGAYWDDRDPMDQTGRFLSEGVWQNGYKDRYLDEVKSMKVGDKIAIKAASTQRKGLPFDNQGKTVSRMAIKAIGTIVANRNDGQTVEVEWEPNISEKVWYFYTNRITFWHLRTDSDYKFKEYADRLKDFVWYGKDQDREWFWERWYGPNPVVEGIDEDPEITRQPYSSEDLVASGAFLTEEEVQQMLKRLESKKAMIWQGPPGVGKTYIARKLAYALMNAVDDERLEMVQFHQSYSYDDFVRGYRPLPGKAGSFGLQDGVFYRFCQKASKDLDRKYVFIIDEINRGNLSQIFGELLMLIEHDKRGKEFAVPLVYQNPDEPRFYLPPNLYLIGLMNVADRSLAMVDYALRRRFGFITLQPQYGSLSFRKWLLDREMDANLVDRIVDRMTALNKLIREDPLLGENYQLGHSYFCPKGNNFTELDESWYRDVVQTEIIPLLKEYWFDNPKKAADAEKQLLA